MSYKIIPVTQLNEKQIIELANLHHRVMHSLLTDLGLPILEKYYQIAHDDSSVIGLCALSETGSPVGWALGSSKPDQLNGRLREAWRWFIFQMLRVLFTHPRLIWQLFVSARSAAAPMQEGAVELTYIGVDTSARKQGLGSALLNGFVQAAHAAKYETVVLSVEAENAEAIALYTKAGFRIIDSFAEGIFNRHRMELTL
jgi:ribosomal protein S18 acetylase RimI-like enzyme